MVKIVSLGEVRARKDAFQTPNRKRRQCAVIDIGSAKTCCLIGELRPRRHGGLPGDDHDVTVLGAGLQPTQGVRHGMIVDLDAAERSIRLAADEAEKTAGVTATEVYAAISCGRPRCRTHVGRVQLTAERAGTAVTTEHMARALRQARASVVPGGQLILHTHQLPFDLDSARGLGNPVGLFGHTLTARLNAVTAQAAPVKNLLLALNRSHLPVAGFALAAFTGAMMALVKDERELGAVYIDMGAASTAIALFRNDALTFADSLPLGGAHVTADLARGLGVSLEEAETLKLAHGAAIGAVWDDRRKTSLTPLDPTVASTDIPLSRITAIIRPRLEEIFEITARMLASGSRWRGPYSVVLGGGGSQLYGVSEMARPIFGASVRQAVHRPLTGLPPALRGPAFSAVQGLLRHVLEGKDRQLALPALTTELEGGYLTRMGRWLRESL